MGVGPQPIRSRPTRIVLIPYSSGMGVGPDADEWVTNRGVLIPYSSGMGVGHAGSVEEDHEWVS